MATAVDQMRQLVTCVVCHDTMTDPVQVSCPARHVFDRDCVTPWIATHHNCPTCRGAVTNTLTPDLNVRSMIEIYRTMDVVPLPGRVSALSSWGSWSASYLSSLWKWYWTPAPPIPPSPPIRFELLKTQSLQITKMTVDGRVVVASQKALETMEETISQLPESSLNWIHRAEKMTGTLIRYDSAVYKISIYCFFQPRGSDYRVLVTITQAAAKGFAGEHFEALKPKMPTH